VRRQNPTEGANRSAAGGHTAVNPVSDPARVVAGFVVSGAFTLLSFAFGPFLLAAVGLAGTWLITTAMLTVGIGLFAALVPPPVMARRRGLVLALGIVLPVLLAAGSILLRRRLGSEFHGSGVSTTVFMLALAAAYAAVKGLGRVEVSDILRRSGRS
jgi:hypothetical protein